jgi:hypothetical protein
MTHSNTIVWNLVSSYTCLITRNISTNNQYTNKITSCQFCEECLDVSAGRVERVREPSSAICSITPARDTVTGQNVRTYGLYTTTPRAISGVSGILCYPIINLNQIYSAISASRYMFIFFGYEIPSDGDEWVVCVLTGNTRSQDVAIVGRPDLSAQQPLQTHIKYCGFNFNLKSNTPHKP